MVAKQWHDELKKKQDHLGDFLNLHKIVTPDTVMLDLQTTLSPSVIRYNTMLFTLNGKCEPFNQGLQGSPRNIWISHAISRHPR